MLWTRKIATEAAMSRHWFFLSPYYCIGFVECAVWMQTGNNLYKWWSYTFYSVHSDFEMSHTEVRSNNKTWSSYIYFHLTQKQQRSSLWNDIESKKTSSLHHQPPKQPGLWYFSILSHPNILSVSRQITTYPLHPLLWLKIYFNTASAQSLTTFTSKLCLTCKM